MTISVPEVETRILRACKTIRVLPDPERKFQTYHSLWPEILRDAAEAYGYADIKVPKWRPQPADVSDCLTALSWARGMDRKEFKLIWWRSFELSFGQMAARLGRSDETARNWYRQARLRVWQAANGYNREFLLDQFGKLASNREIGDMVR